MRTYELMLENNRAWVADRLKTSPDFFERTSGDQQPKFLWIGCSDSRVPAEDITGATPGELFVHRNIANQVIHTDFNVLSVVQYAVEVLEVNHIVVCGHTGCGGVRAALSRQHLGLINKWLRHLKDIYRLYAKELDALDDEQRYKRLIELNVQEQVHHLAELSFVQLAWKRKKNLMLHGLIYDIKTGFLNEVTKVDPEDLPHDIFAYDFPDDE